MGRSSEALASTVLGKATFGQLVWHIEEHAILTAYVRKLEAGMRELPHSRSCYGTALECECPKALLTPKDT